MAYDLLCQCGRALRGERQARHQVLSCPGCGRAVFVLPGAVARAPEPSAPRPSRRWWRAPLAAGSLSLAVLLALFVFLAPYLGRSRDTDPDADLDPKENIRTARRHLGLGKFHLARQLLDEAVAERGRRPDALSAQQSRELNQLQRQADLMARLLTVPLEEVVRQARLVRDPEEWALQFAVFRGRTVLFDDRLRRDNQGRPALADHIIETGGEVVRLALEDLELLRDLPVDDEPRLIFGGRIAACVREEGGWVIRFVRESGVLVTDLDALTACLPAPLDEGVKPVLERQQKWLDERAVVPPAPP